MSKKKFVKKVQALDTTKLIHQMLRTHFACTEEDINLIDHAVKKMLPEEDGVYLTKVHKGEIEPPAQPKFAIEMEDGEVEKFSFTGHPVTVALQYLTEKYQQRLGTLLWYALISSSAQKYYSDLRDLKKMPLFQDILKDDEKSRRSEDGNE